MKETDDSILAAENSLHSLTTGLEVAKFSPGPDSFTDEVDFHQCNSCHTNTSQTSHILLTHYSESIDIES